MVKTFCTSLSVSSICMRQVCHAAIASNSKGIDQTSAVIEARRRGERTRATTLSSPAATKPAVGIAVDGGSICVVMGFVCAADGIDLATGRAGAQPQETPNSVQPARSAWTVEVLPGDRRLATIGDLVVNHEAGAAGCPEFTHKPNR